MTIQEAEEECRQAWLAHPEATWAWCCHHEIQIEKLTGPATDRIEFILKEKKVEEQVTRLNNFRPVLSSIPTTTVESWESYSEYLANYKYSLKPDMLDIWQLYLAGETSNREKLKELHNIDVPNNTWNGLSIL